jgi:hypothetical protein
MGVSRDITAGEDCLKVDPAIGKDNHLEISAGTALSRERENLELHGIDRQ